MQWLIDIVYDAIVSALGHVWDIKDIVPDDQQIIIGDGSIWKGELVPSLIARYPRFVTRGEVADWDMKDADFTTDGTWQLVSLAAIIPVGTKLVEMKLQVRDGLVNSYVQFKTRGQANNFVTSQVAVQVANVYSMGDIQVSPNAAREVQYRANNVVFTNIRMVVKGWWL